MWQKRLVALRFYEALTLLFTTSVSFKTEQITATGILEPLYAFLFVCSIVLVFAHKVVLSEYHTIQEIAAFEVLVVSVVCMMGFLCAYTLNNALYVLPFVITASFVVIIGGLKIGA
ncbi:hypothetical protein B9Q11_04430 [Candidatus Marsarchaeota G2 archaeon ECH_B_SAG-F08]|uniref:Uncharacterized protein n=2 Tax=Candidatus Marsarchaeota group 2 TaxID=2203771 RepID=A0A2R6BF73_9ARCH|nr:MAG: hypothetical protein B9Q11_04430 [Candidatus Marsarchaeota G2 archaeon ECH_B_SAG-F08]PSO05081.1 MAG: hypothetical protein B9Q13_02880 [Candidatus Marsarchaeota G2 archaeon ECH_B_SAG-G16]